MQEVFAAAFSEPPPAQSTSELAAQAGQDTPERRAMAALYVRMPELPPALQMFLAGCPPELEARRQRINRRQVVTRTMLALASGVHRTAYWNLAPEYPGPVDDHQMMYLMIGKLPLLGYTGGKLAERHPAADTFTLLAGHLAGAQTVVQADTGRPGINVFEIHRPGHHPRLVLWEHRDAFAGEDQPPVAVSWPWPAATATVTDAFGQRRTVRSAGGRIELPVSDTPLLVAEQSPAAAQA
jgi:hypothetical protein